MLFADRVSPFRSATGVYFHSQQFAMAAFTIVHRMTPLSPSEFPS